MGFLDKLFNGGALTAQQAKAEMDSGKDYHLIDVRSLEEFKSGHIPSAQLMPLQSLQSSIAQSIPDKKARILVYCQSGGRAASAVQVLEQMGYKNVASIGGIMNWPYEIV